MACSFTLFKISLIATITKTVRTTLALSLFLPGNGLPCNNYFSLNVDLSDSTTIKMFHKAPFALFSFLIFGPPKIYISKTF